VRGLRTKTEALYTSVLSEDYDVVGLTETWLNDGIFDAELVDTRYVIERQDRNSNKSGGRGSSCH